MRELRCERTVSGLYVFPISWQTAGPGTCSPLAVWFGRRRSSAPLSRRLEAVFRECWCRWLLTWKIYGPCFLPGRAERRSTTLCCATVSGPLVCSPLSSGWLIPDVLFLSFFLSYCERVRQLETSLKVFVPELVLALCVSHALSICRLCSVFVSNANSVAKQRLLSVTRTSQWFASSASQNLK